MPELTTSRQIGLFSFGQLKTVWPGIWLSLCLWTLNSFAIAASDETPELRFFSEISAPFFWLDENKQAQGINVDVARALAKELKREAAIEQLPWARAIKETQITPNKILLSLLRSPGRETQYQWLGLVYEMKACLAGLKQNQKINLQSLDDAKSLRVGTIRGYGSADYLLSQGFTEGINLVLVSDTTRLWQMLYEKRIDLVVSSLATDKYELESINLDPLKIEQKIKIPALDAQLQVATGNLTSTQMVAELRKAYSKLQESGELSRILDKWGVR